MDWQILLVISVVTASVSVLIQRILLFQDKTDPIAYAILFEIIVGIILISGSLIHGLSLPDFTKYWLPICATLILFALGNIAYAKSLKLVEASVFSVLFASYAIWVMIGGLIVFNETLLIVQILGALLILVSVALLADRTGKFKLDRGLLLGLLCGAFYGLGITGWVYIGRRSDPLTWNAITFLIPGLLLFLIRPDKLSEMKPFLQKNIMRRIILLAFLASISSQAMLNAFNHGNTSLIAPLAQTEIFLTVLLAAIFLNERKNLILKFCAAATCFIGVILIVG